MRSVVLQGACLSLALLAGCSSEPDFDAKFEQRSRELAGKARQIEADADAQLAAAREAEKARTESEGPLPTARQ